MNCEDFTLMNFNMIPDVMRGALTWGDTLRAAKAAGLSFVDIFDCSPEALAEYRTASEETGVRIDCYICFVSLVGDPDAAERELRRVYAAANSLEAERVMIVPYRMSGEDFALVREHDGDWVRTRLEQGFRRAAAIAAEYGLPICYETTPQDVFRLSGTEDLRWMLERVPEAGLVFDTANMLPHGDETLPALEALRPHIVHVHLKDVALAEASEPLPYAERTADGRVMRVTVSGTGVIPVREVYERLKAGGYTGKFAIEYCRPEQTPATVEEHAARIKAHLAAFA